MAETEPNGHVPDKRRIKIEELYTSSRDEPQSPKLSTSVSEMRNEICDMYLNEYGKGMDQFLETTWYTEQGLRHLLQYTDLCHKFGGMLELFAKTKANDYENFLKLPQIEARVTWMLLGMPRLVSAQTRNGSEQPVSFTAPDAQLAEVLRRLDVLERLITCDPSGQNPLAGDGDRDVILSRQHQFWRQLALFVSLPAGDRNANENCLNQLRQLLDQHENRDVLYSIAVVQHLSSLSSSSSSTLPSLPSLTPSLSTTHTTDATNSPTSSGDERLIVAKKFLEDEASSKGTSQVVQRLCGMAVRSWAAPR